MVKMMQWKKYNGDMVLKYKRRCPETLAASMFYRMLFFYTLYGTG